MATTYPLVSKELNAPIAYLISRKKDLGLHQGLITTKTFVNHVFQFAKALQNNNLHHAGSAINLCKDRYLFLVSFCAVIINGQTNLLAANAKKATQTRLAKTYKNSFIIHDGAAAIDELEVFDINNFQFSEVEESDHIDIPQIANTHLACISFTSGSTGESKAIEKYWQTLHVSSEINARFMLYNNKNTIFQLATMPPQHMWGLETSILLPLFNNICMSEVQPLFPQDIVDALTCLPEPRLLVSTPVHLRALVMDNSKMPMVDTVLCATSPLSSQLASDIESVFTCKLREVYGCSEIGSMAVRETAKNSKWQKFDGIEFTPSNNQDNIIASAKHLPESALLQDNIKLLKDGQFELKGRSSDLVKIAGKRGSLFDINQTLLKFDGLIDGIIFQAEEDQSSDRLRAIVVLQLNIEKKSLTQFLREHLDDAFVPRPIYLVESLPREANGKLSKAKLNVFYQKLKLKP